MLETRSIWADWRDEGRSVRGRDRLDGQRRCRRWFGKSQPIEGSIEFEVEDAMRTCPFLFDSWTIRTKDELLSR